MQPTQSLNSLGALQTLTIAGKNYAWFSLEATQETLGDLSHLPRSIRILLENLLRHEDTEHVGQEDIRSLATYHTLQTTPPTLTLTPSRMVLDDETGLSLMADMAAFRASAAREGFEPSLINPACPSDIIIDNNIPTPEGRERLVFLKWAQGRMKNLRLIPPYAGKSTQVNTDYLTTSIQILEDPDSPLLFLAPELVISPLKGFFSASALGTLTLKDDTLAAESVALEHPYLLTLPAVLGVHVTGRPRKNVHASDIGFLLASLLGQINCTGKIIEFFGEGLDSLSVPDRAVLAGVAEEAGAHGIYFPFDDATLDHMKETGHSVAHTALVESYAKAQGLWQDPPPPHSEEEEQEASTEKEIKTFSDVLFLPLEQARPALAGPDLLSRLTLLEEAKALFAKRFVKASDRTSSADTLHTGDILVAEIGPSGFYDHLTELALAGLIARKAQLYGLKVKPWVRALFRPQSPSTLRFLENAGLRQDLEFLGFRHVAEPPPWPPAPKENATDMAQKNIVAVRLTSHGDLSLDSASALCQAHYRAAPPLVVLYAMTGNFLVDMTQAIGTDAQGNPVMIKDLWPSPREVSELFQNYPPANAHRILRVNLFEGNEAFKAITPPQEALYPWPARSAFLKEPPFYASARAQQKTWPIAAHKGRILAFYGDDIPASSLAAHGAIAPQEAAGFYLTAQGHSLHEQSRFSWYTGNHDVMVRGAFCADQLINLLVPPEQSIRKGTYHESSEMILPLFDVAERYKNENTPLFLVAGKQFGKGDGKEWMAKSIALMGVKAVLAQSFTASARLALLRAGVLPLAFKTGVKMADLKLSVKTRLSLSSLSVPDRQPSDVMLTVENEDDISRYMVMCPMQTLEEVELLRQGSLFALSLANLVKQRVT
ncbi:MAG: aconitase family protein [Alphaproteobacteria bacterium]|nr:aconitase family protein [Alphaproteobacteria bacterium]